MSYQSHKLTQFVPTYVPHSDYLPANKVVDGLQKEVNNFLAQYQYEKAKGRVITQKPAEFDPTRYVSVRTFEDVKVNQPISEEQFKAISNKGAKQ